MKKESSKKPEVAIKKPPVLFKETQRLITQIEKRTGAPLICYWNSHNGSICSNDVVVFYEILKQLKRQPLVYLFVKSSGGAGTSSLRIVNLLRQYAERIVALVPLECASAATMMALGADEIRMGPLSYLSAVDTSLRHDLSPVDRNNALVNVSQDELLRVVKLYNNERTPSDENPFKSLYPFIHPLVFGAVDRASSLSIRLCDEILAHHMEDREKREAISRHLNSDYPSHNYPITVREAATLGLNVHELDLDLNDLLLDLNSRYSEMGQPAITDFDAERYHNNEILNIIETTGSQVFFQNDEDWFYRKEERRWISLNDYSSWIRNTLVKGRIVSSVLHIR